MQIIFTMVYYDIADKGYLVHDDTRIASHFMLATVPFDPSIIMMLGSKGILPPTDAYELLRCEAAPAILQTFEIR